MQWEKGQEEVVISSLEEEPQGKVHKVALALSGPSLPVELVDQIFQEQVTVDVYQVVAEGYVKFLGKRHLAAEQGVREVRELGVIASGVEEEVV